MKTTTRVFGNVLFQASVSCQLSLPLLKQPKLPISIKIRVTRLQIVYICMTAISTNSSS